ncbi:MAG: hypothetical protein Q9227_005462 [Pyrenula ochraceoflavens]
MSGPSPAGTHCLTTSGRSQDSAQSKLESLEGLDKDSLKQWLQLAYTLKDHIFLYLIVPAMVLFCLALITHLLAELTLRAHTNALKSVTVFFSWASITLAIVAAVGTTQTANAVKFFTDPKYWENAPKSSEGQAFWSVSTGAAVQFLQFMIFVMESIWVILSSKVLAGKGDSGSRDNYSYNMS